MASASIETQAQRALWEHGEDLPDKELLELYLKGERREAQQAFQVLVLRHGPMVLGICRHVLNDHHAAEDAFQATFLVLAQKGHSIRNRTVLAGWLHEVAHRIAIKARASAVRRKNLERQGMAMVPVASESNGLDEAAAWNELRPVLHAEVDRLPDKYRLPVILSYLEGKTNEEVAELLHWPIGTVKGRLSRAREVLRSRLMRRGLTLSAAFLVTALAQGRVFAEVVPNDLVRRTVRLAERFGPRAVPPDPGAPEDPPGMETGTFKRVESLTAAGGAGVSFGLRFLRWVLLGLVVASLSAGISWAATNPAGLARLEGALSALIPSSLKPGPPPCH
jgi:RNA polymerase sigma-70 factor (ECF subfamily)